MTRLRDCLVSHDLQELDEELKNELDSSSSECVSGPNLTAILSLSAHHYPSYPMSSRGSDTPGLPEHGMH